MVNEPVQSTAPSPSVELELSLENVEPRANVNRYEAEQVLEPRQSTDVIPYLDPRRLDGTHRDHDLLTRTNPISCSISRIFQHF